MCLEEVFDEPSLKPELAVKFLLFKSVENPSKVVMIENKNRASTTMKEIFEAVHGLESALVTK
jgi:hypothetical protein